jgi:EAL domain-containing protein (putative c-di-GMP-specific phosphodiesterase class I)
MADMPESPGTPGTPPYSYAFQPIVDAAERTIVSFEALVRGPRGESAKQVLDRVPPDALHRFDGESRVAALALAGRLGIACRLNLNVLPRSLAREGEAMRVLIATAERSGVPLDRIVLEVTEGEAIEDHGEFSALVDEYRALGMKVAIDDFGAGYSGLNLLADFQPDMIKLDMNLVRGIESRGARQSIARAIATVCADLGIDVIAEGVETVDEYRWFADEGVRLFQGYLFGRPGFECLPEASFP